MKSLLILWIIFISSSSLAWECYSYDQYNQSIEKHLEMASDVLVGKIVEGKLDESLKFDTNIQLTMEVSVSVKGSKESKVELLTSSHSPNPSFSIGGNYIIFLYGTKEIDFCNVVLELWTPVSSKEELMKYSERRDIEEFEKIAAVAKYLEKNP